MRKIVDGIVQDAKFGMETIKAYVTKADKKKVFLQTLPYIIMAYLCNKVSWLVRSAWGRSVFEKFTFIMTGLNNMFVNPQASFQKQDVVNGIVGGMMFYLVVTYRRKHAKKFRHGMEYGSARWGNEKDMNPYMDPVFENNIILTQTERLMMSARPKKPKFARNKKEIVEAIKEAYRNPITRWEWERMFGENVMPTPEEFIVVMAKKVKNTGVSGNKNPVY